MLAALVALGWPAAGGITPFSGAFWIQQAISAVGSLIFLRWVARLAAGHTPDHSAKVIPFPRR